MAAANDDEQPEAESGCLSGLRVLVVEDSWHVATAIESLLRSFGAEVAGPVASTADAERLLAEQLPDVAIVDINLRGGELAYDLIDKLNDLAVRVIVVSGYSALGCTRTKSLPCCRSPSLKRSSLPPFRSERKTRRRTAQNPLIPPRERQQR
jgi:CheY-like chemotaxis protein